MCTGRTLTLSFLDLRLSDNHDAESHAKSGARRIVPRVLTTRPEPDALIVQRARLPPTFVDRTSV